MYEKRHDEECVSFIKHSHLKWLFVCDAYNIHTGVPYLSIYNFNVIIYLTMCDRNACVKNTITRLVSQQKTKGRSLSKTSNVF